jgi:hypothetical protein
MQKVGFSVVVVARKWRAATTNPVSSRASRNAVSSGDSPASAAPPGQLPVQASVSLFDQQNSAFIVDDYSCRADSLVRHFPPNARRVRTGCNPDSMTSAR